MRRKKKVIIGQERKSGSTWQFSCYFQHIWLQQSVAPLCQTALVILFSQDKQSPWFSTMDCILNWELNQGARGPYKQIALFTYFKGMLDNFLGNQRLWIWKNSYFASHNLWLQKCSYSAYLGNKLLFVFRDNINTAIFLSVEPFVPPVSCLHNFLGGRKLKTSCWEKQGGVVLFSSEMAYG